MFVSSWIWIQCCGERGIQEEDPQTGGSKNEKWPRNYSEPDYLMKEMDIPKNLDHPCITKVLEVQSEKLFVIVMELAPGGELFDQVVHND